MLPTSTPSGCCGSFTDLGSIEIIWLNIGWLVPLRFLCEWDCCPHKPVVGTGDGEEGSQSPVNCVEYRYGTVWDELQLQTN